MCFTEICAAGEFFDQETKSCRACPLGTYENSTGSEECTRCRDGDTTQSEGTTESNDCISGNILLWLNSSKLCSNDILFSSDKHTLCITFFIILCAVLTLKAPITTAADNKFCDIFLNFR